MSTTIPRFATKEVTCEVPLWSGRFDSPTVPVSSVFVHDTETGKYYNGDSPGVLRLKCAGGVVLRSVALMSYMAGGPAAMQAGKFIESIPTILTSQGASWEAKKKSLRRECRYRNRKAKKRWQEASRDISYQSRLLLETAKGIAAPKQKLMKQRAKVGSLEWEHKRAKHSCLMPCFQPLNHAIETRIGEGEDPEEGFKKVVEAERNLGISRDPSSISGQFWNVSWVAGKKWSLGAHVDGKGSSFVGALASQELRPGVEELGRRWKDRFLYQSRVVKQATFKDQARFEGSSFRVVEKLKLKKKDTCFAACLLFLRDLFATEAVGEEDLIEALKEISRRYSRTPTDEMVKEQAVYRAILGTPPSPKVLAPYLQLARGEPVYKRSVPLGELLCDYLGRNPEERGYFRDFALDRWEGKMDGKTYSLISELDLRVRVLNGEDEAPFQHRLAAKNAMAAQYGLYFEEERGYLATLQPYLLNHSSHTEVVVPLPSGDTFIFDPNGGGRMERGFTPNRGTSVLCAGYLQDHV